MQPRAVSLRLYRNGVLILKKRTMEQIYKTLRDLINPRLTKRIAKLLKADETPVSQAISSIFAGFLVLTQRNGDTLQIRNIFDEAASLNILSGVESASDGALAPEWLSIGDNFLQHVLGDKAADFTTWISLETDLSRSAVNKLIAILAPVFVGFAGNKLIGNKWSMRKLMGVISNQKSTYRQFIPSKV